MNERLVLDYRVGPARIYQPTEFHAPVFQRLWSAHTEPDGMRGALWLTDEEAVAIHRRQEKGEAA